eukprot:jgi/Picsp_1/4161/NSC_01670-R1_---NA---
MCIERNKVVQGGCPRRRSLRFVPVILACSLVLLSGVTRVQGEPVEGDALASEYKGICLDYIDQAKAALESGGKTSLSETVFALYIDNPTGPYLFCKDNIPANPSDFGQVTEFIHPYIKLGETEADEYERLTGQAAELFKEQRENISRLAYENRQTGDLFEYTLSINQTQSQDSSSFTAGSGRQYVAFSDDYDKADGQMGVLYCGCPYTNILSGPRDNSNAIAAQAAAASSSVPNERWLFDLLRLIAATIMAHAVL